MDQMESSAANFIPKDLLDITCILQRDEKRHSYKIIRNWSGFSLVAKFRAKNAESTQLKNSVSVQRPVSHQDKKQLLSSGDKLYNKRRKRGYKNSSSSRASGPALASQHMDKKHQKSSDARLADQPKLKKKNTPSQVARDCAREIAYWKSIKVARKLRAENLAAHNIQLQITKTVASPKVSVLVVGHPEN